MTMKNLNFINLSMHKKMKNSEKKNLLCFKNTSISVENGLICPQIHTQLGFF